MTDTGSTSETASNADGAHLRFTSVPRDVDDKGLWVLHGSEHHPPAQAQAGPSGLVVTILTGGRPTCCGERSGRLCRVRHTSSPTRNVVVMGNGADEETEAYVRSLPFVDRLLRQVERRPVGVSTSRLAEAAGQPLAEYLLHLEDDWASATLDDSWLSRRRAILRGPSVGRPGAPTPPQRAESHGLWRAAPLEQDGGFLLARSAHFMFNPTTAPPHSPCAVLA